jgi:hypothetical protein
MRAGSADISFYHTAGTGGKSLLGEKRRGRSGATGANGTMGKAGALMT